MTGMNHAFEKDYIRNHEKIKGLVVDDDPHDIFLTKVAFKHFGTPVELVGMKCGEELFTYIRDFGTLNFQFVLLDINMPRQSGLDILRVLNKWGLVDRIDVIMFSTSRQAKDVKTCEELGARAFLTKPASRDEMQAFVSDITHIIS